MSARKLRAVTFLAPNMLPVYQSILRAVGKAIGYDIKLVSGKTYDEVGDADLSLICGLPYVLRTSPRIDSPQLEAINAPVLQGERYHGKPVYFSDVIVHQDSPYQSFADLRGCSWAYNEPESQSGYGITRYTLATKGETKGYFGTIVEAGFHQKAIRLVANRQVDASAIDSQVLAVELREHPKLAHKIRVIDALGPSTIQPIAANPRLPDALIGDIQQALTEIHRKTDAKQWLEWGFIERIVSIEDSDYDDIRNMLAVCEQADFLKLR